MIVLLTGASGFIGHRIALALRDAGHQVLGVARDPSRLPTGIQGLHGDFSRDLTPDIWTPRLRGVDVAINAVGIIRQARTQRFELLHERAPIALFEACAAAGVRRVVQISALGADAAAESEYHRSKRAADERLRRLAVDSVIVQPSLVFGPEGASSRMFLKLASMPVIALPGGGATLVQPVHVEDLVAAVLRLVEAAPAPGGAYGTRTIIAAGTEALSLRDYLLTLRHGLGIPGGVAVVTVPWSLSLAGAWLASVLSPRVPLDTGATRMLMRPNTGSTSDLRALLGRAPRAPRDFLPQSLADALRDSARLGWLLPLLRVSLGLLWIVTGLLSLGVYPREHSYELLGAVGVPGVLQPAMLLFAATLDLALGIGVLLFARRRWLWATQIAAMLAYTLVITWRLPEFWVHPFAPVLKNLPLLAATALIMTLESRR